MVRIYLRIGQVLISTKWLLFAPTWVSVPDSRFQVLVPGQQIFNQEAFRSFI